MKETPIPVRVRGLDPISEIGVLAQLRYQPEVVIADPNVKPAVVLAVMDSADDQALCWLKALRADGGLPIVLVIGLLDPRTLVTVVESGVCGVVRRAEATPDRLVRAIRSAAHGQ